MSRIDHSYLIMNRAGDSTCVCSIVSRLIYHLMALFMYVSVLTYSVLNCYYFILN